MAKAFMNNGGCTVEVKPLKLHQTLFFFLLPLQLVVELTFRLSAGVGTRDLIIQLPSLPGDH